jgi:hypothetical protein
MPAEVAVSIQVGDIDKPRQLLYWLTEYGYLVTSMRVKGDPRQYTDEELRSMSSSGSSAFGKPVLQLVCSDLIGKTHLLAQSRPVPPLH